MSGFAEWKDRILFWAVTTSICGLGALLGWIATSHRQNSLLIQSLPSRAEVLEIVKEQAPYVRDERLIQQRFQAVTTSLEQLAKQSNRSEQALKTVVDRNTEAINKLTVELAKIRAN